jgi:secretion/DNA translocation related TadE-like protein
VRVDRRDTRGNVSMLVIAVIVVAVLLGTAVARLGSGVVEKSRANNAADAAALAAAGGLALGRLPADACAAARDTAADNGARLLTCRCRAAKETTVAEVTVAMGAARARARAEVDAADLSPRSGLSHKAREEQIFVANRRGTFNFTNRTQPLRG